MMTGTCATTTPLLTISDLSGDDHIEPTTIYNYASAGFRKMLRTVEGPENAAELGCLLKLAISSLSDRQLRLLAQEATSLFPVDFECAANKAVELPDLLVQVAVDATLKRWSSASISRLLSFSYSLMAIHQRERFIPLAFPRTLAYCH